MHYELLFCTKYVQSELALANWLRIAYNKGTGRFAKVLSGRNTWKGVADVAEKS